jgi:hypothetical protein
VKGFLEAFFTDMPTVAHIDKSVTLGNPSNKVAQFLFHRFNQLSVHHEFPAEVELFLGFAPIAGQNEFCFDGHEKIDDHFFLDQLYLGLFFFDPCK